MIAAGAVVLIAWVLGPFLTGLPMPAIAGVLVLVGIGMIQGHPLRPFRIEGAVLASVAFFVASVSKVELTISQDGDQERIEVGGNLFYASLDRLAKHLRGDPSAHTILDLRCVPYCDAAARDMIQNLQKERLRHGGKLDIA